MTPRPARRSTSAGSTPTAGEDRTVGALRRRISHASISLTTPSSTGTVAMMLRSRLPRRLLGLLLAVLFLSGGLAVPHDADAAHEGDGPHVSHQHHHGHGVVLIQGDFEAPTPLSVAAGAVPAPRIRTASLFTRADVRSRTSIDRPTSRAPPSAVRPRAPPTAIS